MKGECPICFQAEWLEQIHDTPVNSEPHTACLTCLNDIRKRSDNDSVLCPFCRKETISDKDPVRSEGQITIYVCLGTFPTGRKVAVHVYSDETVLDVKKRVEILTGIPPWGVFFVRHHCRKLANTERLCDLKLGHGDLLNFYLGC